MNTTATFQFTPVTEGVEAPLVVTAARVVAGVQAAIVLTAGVLLATGDVLVGLGIASIVEGAIRLGLALALRRGARRIRIALLVMSGIGVFVGAMAGGLSLVGAALSAVVLRCLNNDDAKEFLGA